MTLHDFLDAFLIDADAIMVKQGDENGDIVKDIVTIHKTDGYINGNRIVNLINKIPKDVMNKEIKILRVYKAPDILKDFPSMNHTSLMIILKPDNKEEE